MIPKSLVMRGNGEGRGEIRRSTEMGDDCEGRFYGDTEGKLSSPERRMGSDGGRIGVGGVRGMRGSRRARGGGRQSGEREKEERGGERERF
ncbi:hypothetical protein Tco_0649426 [Tanacetum coccineum]